MYDDTRFGKRFVEYTRKHPRVPLKVRVHCTGEGVYFSDVTANVSEGGVGLETVSQIKPGERLQLEFISPELGKIMVETTVVWVNPAKGEESRNQAGLRFSQLSPEHREQLTYYLQAQNPGTRS